MQYRVFTDDRFERLLATFERDSNLKPNVGDILTIGKTRLRRLYVITRERPNTRPPFPETLPGVIQWQKPDDKSTVIKINELISKVTDKSGNSNDLTQSIISNQPSLIPNIANGKDVIRFTGFNPKFLESPSLQALTEAEVFIVVKIETDPPLFNTQSGLWTYSASPQSAHYPLPDGRILESFGTNTRTPTFIPLIDLSSQFRIYNVISTPTEYTVNIDSTQIFTRATNTVAFSSGVNLLGESLPGPQFLDGDIAELIIINRKLTDDERKSMDSYLETENIIFTPSIPISFDFFVSIQNTTPDSVSLKASNNNIQKKLNRFG